MRIITIEESKRMAAERMAASKRPAAPCGGCSAASEQLKAGKAAALMGKKNGQAAGSPARD